MIEAVASGVLLGVSCGLSPGPLMALVLLQSVPHGARQGCKVACVADDLGIRRSGPLFRDERQRLQMACPPLTAPLGKGRLKAVMKQQRRGAQKKIDYPETTAGSRLAAKARKLASKLTPEQRREHFNGATAMIYAGAKEAALPRR